MSDVYDIYIDPSSFGDFIEEAVDVLTNDDGSITIITKQDIEELICAFSEPAKDDSEPVW